MPVRNGASRIEPTAEGKRAIGMIGGQDFVTVEIRSSSEPCQIGSGLLKYPVLMSQQIMVNEIPFVGEVCKAEPVSVKVTAPEGDPFSALKPLKLLWAIEFKNGAFSIGRPVAAAK